MSQVLDNAIQPDAPALLAAEWLLNSGIQDTEENKPTYGGVNAWYDLTSGSYPFVYSEITGYAVNAFLHSFHLTGDEAYAKAAKLAARCLLRHRDSKTGLVYNRIWHGASKESYYDSWIFTFDQWVIVYGLISLYEDQKDDTFRSEAEVMAQFLMESTVRDDGSFDPVYDFEKEETAATFDKWSRQPGPFHAKALMALLKLFEITKNDRYFEYAERLAKVTLTMQSREGRFITQTNEKSTHLHPHLYTLEGLMSFGLATDNKDYLDAVERGLKWVLDHCKENGEVNSFYKDNRFVPYVRCDILAQALRVGALLLRQGRLKGYDEKLAGLRKALLRYQIVQGPQKGGFFYGQEQDGTIHYHVNAWVSMFAAQALWLYDYRDNLTNSYSMELFV